MRVLPQHEDSNQADFGTGAVMAHKFPYEWTLKDAKFTKDKGTVFSCFACGGGSTMGYKLAGFDVIGCNEIDPKMMEAYRANHNPRFSYLEPIQTFKDRDDLPPELYSLDILDGSPPCSSFSMAGNREKDWGKDKKFREGQAEQVLDTLFFDFIDLAKKLQPKVVIAENVKGMLMGEAQKYVDGVLRGFCAAGYYVSYKLLDASRMGVPQRRERVFFYAVRKDLYNGPFDDLFGMEPTLGLEFGERQIPFGEIDDRDTIKDEYRIGPAYMKYLKLCQAGCSFSSVHPDGSLHSPYRVSLDNVVNTIPAHNDGTAYHYEYNRRLSRLEFCRAGTYPIDYDFFGNRPNYLIGMSVPPVMTAQVATRVYEQWLKPMLEDQ